MGKICIEMQFQKIIEIEIGYQRKTELLSCDAK